VSFAPTDKKREHDKREMICGMRIVCSRIGEKKKKFTNPYGSLVRMPHVRIFWYHFLCLVLFEISSPTVFVNVKSGYQTTFHQRQTIFIHTKRCFIITQWYTNTSHHPQSLWTPDTWMLGINIFLFQIYSIMNAFHYWVFVKQIKGLVVYT
jgi:hypothetical protein